MALAGIYNNDREIVLTQFQAQVFNQTVQYFRTNGVGGDNIFEDTYVLQKRIAEYIKQNIPQGGNAPSTFINQVYNGVLGITTTAPAPPAAIATVFTEQPPISNISDVPVTATAAPVSPAAPAGPVSDGPAPAGNTNSTFATLLEQGTSIGIG
jgi:hypothetical protein